MDGKNVYLDAQIDRLPSTNFTLLCQIEGKSINVIFLEVRNFN